jgi:glucokinase
MLLAGDIGGTKTLLGLFGRAPERPPAIEVGEFATLDYDGLVPMIREFLKARGIEARSVAASTFGVAGAITDQVARLTNVPWLVDAAEVGEGASLRRVHLLNDLEALAFAVPVLNADELAVLQHGIAQSGGNAAVIAAGTGLGEAMLHNIDGRFVPAASEGGHADWGARTRREIEMLDVLTRIYHRVSVEHVVSGPGLVNVYQFTHDAFGTSTGFFSTVARLPDRLCAGVGRLGDVAELPARITKSAMDGRCELCGEALDLFVAAYGAEAGNLALRTVATAGVYVGGGIAPKLLPAFEGGTFLDAFRSKEPLADFVATIPVAVILNPEAGLVGAAVHANGAA